jgi:hypothetical protein
MVVELLAGLRYNTARDRPISISNSDCLTSLYCLLHWNSASPGSSGAAAGLCCRIAAGLTPGDRVLVIFAASDQERMRRQLGNASLYRPHIVIVLDFSSGVTRMPGVDRVSGEAAGGALLETAARCPTREDDDGAGGLPSSRDRLP